MRLWFSPAYLFIHLFIQQRADWVSTLHQVLLLHIHHGWEMVKSWVKQKDMRIEKRSGIWDTFRRHSKTWCLIACTEEDVETDFRLLVEFCVQELSIWTSGNIWGRIQSLEGRNKFSLEQSQFEYGSDKAHRRWWDYSVGGVHKEQSYLSYCGKREIRKGNWARIILGEDGGESDG